MRVHLPLVLQVPKSFLWPVAVVIFLVFFFLCVPLAVSFPEFFILSVPLAATWGRRTVLATYIFLLTSPFDSVVTMNLLYRHGRPIDIFIVRVNNVCRSHDVLIVSSRAVAGATAAARRAGSVRATSEREERRTSGKYAGSVSGIAEEPRWAVAAAAGSAVPQIGERHDNMKVDDT